MASTILVNTINTQSGSTITIPTGKTLAVTDAGGITIAGTAVTTGSSNILRKTADYTIVTGDVSGKSELVIACNAASAVRTITLPAVAAAGMSTCIITVAVDTNAGAAHEVKVVDASAVEIWSGTDKGDFVRLIVSNSAWVVLDHEETYFEYRGLTTTQSISGNTFAKWNASTSNISKGAMWDTGNNRLTIPFDGYLHVNINISPNEANNPSISSGLKIGAAGSPSIVFQNPAVAGDGRITGPTPYNGVHLVTDAQVAEPWVMNNDDDVHSLVSTGTPVYTSTFMFRMVRRYT